MFEDLTLSIHIRRTCFSSVSSVAAVAVAVSRLVVPVIVAAVMADISIVAFL